MILKLLLKIIKKLEEEGDNLSINIACKGCKFSSQYKGVNNKWCSKRNGTVTNIRNCKDRE